MRISDWSSDVCSSDLPANNQLASNESGDELEKRGILYAPDYAVNAGGVMNVALEITGYNRERAMRQMRTIYHNLARIYEIAERDGIPTYTAADRIADERTVVMGQPKFTPGRTTPDTTSDERQKRRLSSEDTVGQPPI